MGSPRSDGGLGDIYSHAPRSRTNSGVSTTEGLFRSLELVDSPPTSYASSSTSIPSSSHLALDSFARSHLTLPAEGDLDADWFDTPQTAAQGTPLLRVDPAESYSRLTPSSSPTSNPQSSTMSTVALHYDPTFDMAARSLFSWSGIDSGSGLLGHDLSSFAAEPSLTPPSGGRSLSSSPPRGSLSAERRELKRQQDQARHNAKLRARKTNSGSSYGHSPPVTLTDLTSSVEGLPIYTTAPSQISLLSEPTSTISPQPYISSFPPTIPDQSQTELYPNAYATNQYMPVNYSQAYPVSTSSSLAPSYGPTMADPSLMYPPATAGMPMSIGSSPSPSVVPEATSSHVRVVSPVRPKPQCWEHGCNGRQFSTFSNLLRHQREKSGQAAKASCPNCGAEFTRTTARNGHLQHDKCKQKRSNGNSGGGNISS